MSDRMIPLAEALGIGAGGKAEGLARLVALGLRVPPGFVVLDPEADLPPRFDALFDGLGGPVAVRSSASDEDSADTSFAGQHLTVLDVRSATAAREAVRRCAASLAGAHARAYRARHGDRGADDAKMAVVVQRMVPARAAGVAFSVDPVDGRRDVAVVDAVRGLGESLVGGHATPEHHRVARDGRILESSSADDIAVLFPDEVLAIAGGVRRIAAAFGHPVDAEWAIDPDGSLHWLQARPVTALPADPRELDPPSAPDHVYTKCNIGEMMPGAATPLTRSTSVRGIDHGMQRLYAEIGVLPRARVTPRFTHEAFGHLFLDLTSLRDIAGRVAGASEADVASAICGREVPELGLASRASPTIRAWNGLLYARAVTAHERHIAALDSLLARVRLPDLPRAEAAYAAIDAALPSLLDAYYHHLGASLQAGALASALLRVVANGEAPDERHHAEVASLLAGAEGVESQDIAAGIDRVVRVVIDSDGAAPLLAAGRDDTRASIAAIPAAEQALRDYLLRHGHRCVREVELREPEWAVDPRPVLDAVFAGVRAHVEGRARRSATQVRVPLGLRPLVRMAHTGVRAREAAKSRLVALTVRFKAAYRHLATLLVREGRLKDADLVYFLTHEELGAQIHVANADLARRAELRRAGFPSLAKLVFPDVFVGDPEPTLPPPPDGSLVLRGKPVSRGVVRGRARVARTLEEARAIEPGEILIAPITDVGWTPVFGSIAGLATDIGSAVSHGAVVAREYGLPALVDVRHGTTSFRTGDRVELDADVGVLRRLADDE